VSILVLNTSPFIEQQRAALAQLAPNEEIHCDPLAAPPDDVEALLAFRLAPGIAARFPALKLVACAGAGVDQLLANSDVPAHVPVVRAFDPMQGQRMAQYVTLMALRFHRELPRLETLHAEGQWHRFLPLDERKHASASWGTARSARPSPTRSAVSASNSRMDAALHGASTASRRSSARRDLRRFSPAVRSLFARCR
jgi:phosphoglycerate dehydrogenase-like enzyme